MEIKNKLTVTRGEGDNVGRDKPRDVNGGLMHTTMGWVWTVRAGAGRAVGEKWDNCR